jgi:predicted acylesterase/phospholipase RssA
VASSGLSIGKLPKSISLDGRIFHVEFYIMKMAEKYQRCLVMAGGGFRFGYYLGIYAALCESNKHPDLLLASCGGAIAAAAIQAFPSDAQRKEWISSPEMYQFFLQLKSSQKATIARSLVNVFKRRLSSANAKTIPDLFNDYLFEIPQDLPWPSTMASTGELDVAIIAGKLLYTEGEVEHRRGQRKLFAETVFCSPRTANLLYGASASKSTLAHDHNAIAEYILSDVNMPMAQAVRASISDMFYFRCHSYQGSDYIGGVINLFPIEMAHHLAHEVVMELKGPYDKLFSIPALRFVLGIDGGQRLNDVLQQHAEMWVDTSDMGEALRVNQIAKKILWRKNRIALVMPDSHDNYVKMIDAQWQYGYRRGLAGVAKSIEK